MAAYHRPTTLEKPSPSAPSGPVTVLAGGTDVYPAKAARVGWGDMRQPDVLDISACRACAVSPRTATAGASAR